MKSMFANFETLVAQETYRAKEIVKVAEREGKDPAITLRDYGVWTSIINEIGIDIVEYVPKVKKISVQQQIEDWSKQHIGETIKGGKQISKEMGVSYATANKFVQSRRDIFAKVKSGTYIIKDSKAERLAS
jgi:hypothetical protein